MTIRNLENMFVPKSLALIGVGERPFSVGHVLMQNVLQSGFAGTVMPVNPKYNSVSGMTCYPDVKSLPETPDLAVLCVGAEHVPQAIADLAARGTRAAVVISAGFGEVGTAEGKKLEQDMLAAAKPHNLRIIGPNCVGVMVPGAKLNASFAHIAPSAGSLAFVSQSGALCTAILDYVAERDIGFSHFVSLGNCSDVDFGDMLDYLAADPTTSAILLYIEAVTSVRKFMSAARAASRNKPVIVIKSGRNKAGAKAAASHTGALIGSDGVYDVAFKRAGMLRVYDMEELFDAVETLARVTKSGVYMPGNGAGDALVMVTNGGGPAVLATDALVGQGGKLAELSSETIAKLNKVLPPTWSHGNPVDIIGDADGKRYQAALEVVMQAPEAEALFVMKCPTAVSDNVEAAKAVIGVPNEEKKLLLTCWLGEATARDSRRLFAQAGIPTYETPEKAVREFLHIAQYRHNQAMLMEVPPNVARDGKRDREAVKAIIAKAFLEGRSELFEHEAKDVFVAYGIPVVQTISVSTAEEAAQAAERIGFPVVLKIVSPDISHKTDVGGVMLDLKNKQEVLGAAQSMLKTIGTLRPEAKLQGFNVEQMAAKRDGYELIVGMSTDRQFGPVLMFGEGGVAVEVIDDKALALPPVNSLLAEDMIKSTRIYKRLKGFRDRKPVPLEAISGVLVQVSQLVTDIAEISELDINPLIADSAGVIALDARIKLAKTELTGTQRLVISTYPQQLEETAKLKNGSNILLRPIRPQDAAALKSLIETLTPNDLYQRFRGEYPALSASQIARVTHIDYDRDMVLVAMSGEEMVGCLLCTMHPGSTEAEFTLVVRSDHKGQGIGYALTDKIIRYVSAMPQMASLFGYALPGNDSLLDMLHDFHFVVETVADEKLIKVSKALR